MPSGPQALSSVGGCCPNHHPPSTKKTCNYIAIALSIIVLLGGIFLILAAHNVLLCGSAINSLKGWGYAALGIGSVGAVCSLWRLYQKPNLGVRPDEDLGPTVDDEQIDLGPTVDDEQITDDPLGQQIRRVRAVDTRAAPNSWKKSQLGREEREQSYDAFIQSPERKHNANRNSLQIVIMDEGISQRERELLKIVVEYIQHIHGIRVTLEDKFGLGVDQQRGKQYAFEPNVLVLYSKTPDTAFALGLMSHDLYSCTDDLNFCFGGSTWQLGCGLFSVNQFRDEKKDEITLKRLMNLVSHEFSHLLGLEHCTKYACQMQGTNNLRESDATPLYFCAQDMAKICHLNHWSLREGYEKQLTFFENFKNSYRSYRINVDFTREVEHLKRKISACLQENTMHEQLSNDPPLVPPFSSFGDKFATIGFFDATALRKGTFCLFRSSEIKFCGKTRAYTSKTCKEYIIAIRTDPGNVLQCTDRITQEQAAYLIRLLKDEHNYVKFKPLKAEDSGGASDEHDYVKFKPIQFEDSEGASDEHD
jgi:predicted Zn-dependent protease